MWNPGFTGIAERLKSWFFRLRTFLQLKAELQIYEVDIDEKESAVQNLQRAYQIFRSVLQYDNDLLKKKEQRIKELLQAAGLTSEDIQKLLKTTDTWYIEIGLWEISYLWYNTIWVIEDNFIKPLVL